MAAPSGGDARKTVLAAMLANGGIAIAKFVAAGLSGSITMMAEGVHSVADTANQGLLLLGMGLSKKRDPERYPLGRAKESYFWGFVVSLMLFFLGGVYAIYEGVHKLLHPSEPGSPLVPVIVLTLSMVLEGGSFYVALREFNKTRGDRSISQALFSGKDPVIPIVVLEDSGAMLGLALALIAVVLTWVTGSTLYDGIGSITIGVLLCTIGIALAKDTRSLLIGEGVSEEVKSSVLTLAQATEGVSEVTQLLSLHLGPDTALLALKVRFADGMSVVESERVIDDLEKRIREKHPQMKRIFVEPDSDYDVARDPKFLPVD